MTDGKPSKPVIETHIARRPPGCREVPLLTPKQEAELEKDLVPEDRWDGVRIEPIHRRGQ